LFSKKNTCRLASLALFYAYWCYFVKEKVKKSGGACRCQDDVFGKTVRAKSKEQRAKSKEQRAESKEQRAKSRGQRAEAREQRAESKGLRDASKRGFLAI
jgi:hypothetical protein